MTSAFEDKTLYVLRGGEWIQLAQAARPEHANHVIVCDHGDWSGFLTLNEALARFDSLKQLNRPDDYFRLVER